MAAKKKRYTDVKRRITRTPTGFIATKTDERAYIPLNTPENRALGRVQDYMAYTSSDSLGYTGQSRAAYERMQQRTLGKIGRSMAATENKALSKAGKSAKNPAARAAQAQYKAMIAADVSERVVPTPKQLYDIC